MPPPEQPHFVAWCFCSTCQQRFTGPVTLQLAIVLWAKHAHDVETSPTRLATAASYTVALNAAGEHVEAARLERGTLVGISRNTVSQPESRLYS